MSSRIEKVTIDDDHITRMLNLLQEFVEAMEGPVEREEELQRLYMKAQAILQDIAPGGN